MEVCLLIAVVMVMGSLIPGEAHIVFYR